MPGLGIAAHHRLVVDCLFGSNCVGDLVDLSGQRLGAGQAKDVVDAVLLTPGHRLGAGVMAVATEGDARVGPAPANVPNQAAQMRTNLNATRRFAGAQDNRNRPAALCVVDVDRQKAVLVVMGVEQRELLTAMNHVDGVVDVERHHARRPPAFECRAIGVDDMPRLPRLAWRPDGCDLYDGHGLRPQRL
jgi:hypothetical protein